MHAVPNVTWKACLFVLLISLLLPSGVPNAHADLQDNGFANPTKEKRKVLGVDTTGAEPSVKNVTRLNLRVPYRANKKQFTPVVSYGRRGGLQTATSFKSYASLGSCKSFTRSWRSRMRKILKKGAKVVLHGLCIQAGGGSKVRVHSIF